MISHSKSTALCVGVDVDMNGDGGLCVDVDGDRGGCGGGGGGVEEVCHSQDSARTSPIGDPIEDKVIASELRNASNRRSNGTPIDQEMSKEVESKHNPPSVVAKLMGLDTLPRQQSDSAAQRSHSRDYARSHSDSSL
ncbi:hypothetical protein LOK49_LG09G02256 [Camellia lanceoleosa]|uniref:Uncharacterized protein n=1 Tax=Camellia lanceoleosa TaxID=1840588 RepID=A0ACC0GFD6_9ERIC|nr:hypothetical protein LOK49_LG09G02256 [Camellia lanceoleosa]